MAEEIKVSLLTQHPKNLRKEYRDIDELAASIKTEGVLQNLVVIPDKEREGHYLVISGNRRLLAARKAGVETVPCVVKENMSEAAVAQFMLTENMQRNDLTPVEEAYGIQMCIEDFGIPVKNLAKQTGLSETTIRHRINIAKLDKDILDEVPAQVTLKEYQELEKLKNIEDRNEAAKLLGKPGFTQKVNDMVQKENIEGWKEKAEKILDGFATKVSKMPENVRYVESYYFRYSGDSDIPEGQTEGEYYYIVNYSSITLYKALTEDEIKDEYEDDEEDEDEEEREKREKERNAIFEKYYHRRLGFIKSREGELAENDLTYHLLKAMLNDPPCWKANREAWKEIHGEDLNVKRDIMAPSPSVNQANITDYLYCRLEFGDESLDLTRWNGEYEEDHPKADALYSLLDDMGYIADETEDAMLDGTWEFYEGNDEEDEEEEDDEE